MEIIFTLVKYLTAYLSPTAFLAVALGLIVIGVVGFRYAYKYRVALGAFFVKGEDSNLKAINSRLESMVTRAEVDAAFNRIELILSSSFSESHRAVDGFKDKFVEITTLRQQMADKDFTAVVSELDELRDAIRHNQTVLGEQNAQTLSVSGKLHDSQQRALSQLEKIDEYVKAAVPEFRAYHRELGTDIKILSKDIELVERSIHLQLNSSTNTVQLR